MRGQYRNGSVVRCGCTSRRKMALFSRKPLATTALTNLRAVFMADCGVSMRKVVLFHEGLVAFERQSEKNGRLQNDNPGMFLFVIALFNSMLWRWGVFSKFATWEKGNESILPKMTIRILYSRFTSHWQSIICDLSCINQGFPHILGAKNDG